MNQVKCKVVMLPTEKATIGTIMKYIKFLPSHNNALDGEIGDLVQNQNSHVTKTSEYYEAQHLYVLSDEEIKEGDYFLDTGRNNKLLSSGPWKLGALSARIGTPNDAKKVISSTDQSLGLPRPSDSFIKKYCKKGGIDEVMVELEIDEKSLPVFDGAYKFSKPYILKVAPDNTITIRLVKDSWTREEITAIIHKFADHIMPNTEIDHAEYDKWIKANL